MAEMADLTKALGKLEVNPAASSPQKKPHEEESTYQASGSASSPPPTEQPEESKAQEASPPPPTQQAEESKAQEASSPPKAQQSEDSKEASPPKAQLPEKPKESSSQTTTPSGEAKALSPPKPQESQDPSPPEEDLLEFTSATEGEEGGSSSAWDLVPPEQPRIARKKVVKSDSELDSLVKKVIKEAESSPPITSEQLTTSSSSSKAAITSIAEEPTKEAEAAEAEKSNWEPDFSFEDGPEQSKDTVTSSMGRKDLMTMDVTSDEGDQEMADVDPSTGSHLASGAKRKGRSVSHGAKKRALPPKSPRTSSVGAKAKSPQPIRPASANKMPRSSSPQAKAESKVADKPPVKPPPKGITPMSAPAVAKPPPKSVTAAAAAAEKEAKAKAAAEEKQAKARAEKEAKAIADWEKAKETVAERNAAAAAAPKSPPLFTTDWSKITSREVFLQKTAETYRLDPNSAEGFNHHVASYYYFSSDWGVSHPQSYSSLMLKSDSRQSHRWTCVHCRVSHPDICDHKTVEAGVIHWWRHHCHHSSWIWCEKASVFNITTADICKAVLDVDMSERPLPLGGAFHMLPNNLPSHPKGLDTRLFKHPYNKALTPAHHPSEQGLPWNQHIEELQREEEVELTNWKWDLFFPYVLEGNTDVLCFLIHPFTTLTEYVNSRKAWHSRAITSPGAREFKDHLVDVEQHAFMLILLKVLTTKADSLLMPPGQVERVHGYLRKYEGLFPDRAQEILNKAREGISDSDRDYVGTVKEYALAAHQLVTPVNIWRIPYPRGHAAVCITH